MNKKLKSTFFILLLLAFPEIQIHSTVPLAQLRNDSEALLPKDAAWLLGVSLGAGFGYYTRTQMTPFVPIHWALDVAYKSLTLSMDGLLGWPSTRQNLLFSEGQVNSGAPALMFQGIVSLGFNVWVTERLYINPQFGFGVASIGSEDAQTGARIKEFSRGLLNSSLSLTYEFPIQRNDEGRRSKFPYQSIFIRLLAGYSVTTFDLEGKKFDGDLLRIIIAVGSNYRSSP